MSRLRASTRNTRKRYYDSDEEAAETLLSISQNTLKNSSFESLEKSPPPKKQRARTSSNRRKKKTPKRSIQIDSDVEDRNHIFNKEIINKVETKMDTFFKSLLSDDEEDDVSESTSNIKKSVTSKDNKKDKNPSFYVLTDSDEDVKTVGSSNTHKRSISHKKLKNDSNCYDLSDSDSSLTTVLYDQPSTSGCQSNTKKALNNTKNDYDEVLTLVNNAFPTDEDKKNKDSVTIDNKEKPGLSWEEYKKETDEILQSANDFIQELEKDTKKEEKKEEQPKEVIVDSPKKAAPSCPICLETLGAEKPASTTFCGHMFCKPCITTVIKTTKKCPTCRKVVNAKKIISVYL